MSKVSYLKQWSLLRLLFCCPAAQNRTLGKVFSLSIFEAKTIFNDESLHGDYEHVYSHKAAQKEQHKNSNRLYSLAYIYIKQVVPQINS